MTILVFIVVIVALIVVHELGHLLAAKLSGMRVDEFGLGYPPRALVIGKRGGTLYTLNWIPFGGFVKIRGENGEEKGPGSFASRPRILQAFVLIAGVAMNLLFAYVLLTGALIVGTPRALSPAEIPSARDTRLVIAEVLPGTPAERAGLQAGDVIVAAEDGHFMFEGSDAGSFTQFVAKGGGNATVALTVRHADGREETLFARPEKGIVTSEPSRAALGIDIVNVGVMPASFSEAIVEGAQITWGATALTAVGLWNFFRNVFMFTADFSQVAGPVGIAGAVGAASSEGAGNLFALVALISINLALINLVPVPALDGGRFLFVLIEGVIRRPIAPRVVHALNAMSFVLLILLMVAITAHDIFKIVG